MMFCCLLLFFTLLLLAVFNLEEAMGPLALFFVKRSVGNARVLHRVNGDILGCEIK